MQGEGRSYEVVTDALTNHARTLSGLAGELRTVLDLLAGVSITAEAYGQVGRKAASAINALGTVGQDTLREGVAALESAATEVRETVATYEQQEAEGVDLYTNLDDALESLPETPSGA
jgi:Excreted virulence factor EspC, type VII ESX diderm